MTSCLIFVFAALLEFAVVNVVARKQELKKQLLYSKQVIYEKKSNLFFRWIFLKHKRNKKLQNPSFSLLNPKEEVNLAIMETLKPTLPHRDYAQLVDFISGFMFPIIFIIFNIMYWVTYFNLVSFFFKFISYYKMIY